MRRFEPRFCQLAGGDVGQHAERTVETAIRAAHGLGADDEPAVTAILVAKPEVMDVVMTLAPSLHVDSGIVARRVVHEIVHRTAIEFRDAVAEHGRHARIDERRPAFGVDDPDAFVGGLDDVAVSRFALRQAALDHLLAGDLDETADGALGCAGRGKDRLVEEEVLGGAVSHLDRRFILEHAAVAQQGAVGGKMADRFFGRSKAFGMEADQLFPREPEHAGQRIIDGDVAAVRVLDEQRIGKVVDVDSKARSGTLAQP